jgi:hypothetical protein
VDSGELLDEGMDGEIGPIRGILRCVGPKTTEDQLLGEVSRFQNQIARAPERLSQPVLIIVSSEFLRKRLLFRLSRHFPTALLGVRVATMTSVAAEVCKALEARSQGSRLLPLLIHRALQEESTLGKALGDLESGASTVVGAVGDLLDAGFDPALDEVLLESLASENPFHISPEHSVAHPELGQRVSALIGLTTRVAGELEEQNLELPGQLLQRAADQISAGTELHNQRIFIHGFAEATGAATLFLEALVAHRNALLFLSTPEDPAVPGTLDLGARFTERLCTRLSPYGYSEDISFVDRQPVISCRVARGMSAEVNEATLEILGLLKAGVAPETIALCARDLEPYKSAISQRMEDLGVPFSVAKSEGAVLPEWYPVQKLLQFLNLGPQLTVEPWLDLCAPALWHEKEEPWLAKDLIRSRVLEYGIAKVSDLPALCDPLLPSDEAIDCGALIGLKSFEGGANTGRRRIAREQVAAEDLLLLGRHTAEALQGLEEHTGLLTVQAHRTWVLQLCLGALGNQSDSNMVQKVDALFHKIQDWVPESLVLSLSECLELLEKAFDSSARQMLGGAGGGISVVNAMEARACTFEHLFILGVNRGVFPRASVEDPMLPDSHRLRLRNSDVLPDIPIKQSANAEERYLFAELMGASPQVHLSWLLVDDDGRDCAASPFLERLRPMLGCGADHEIPLARAPRALQGALCRTPLDFSVLYGLYGSRSDLVSLWGLTHGATLEPPCREALLTVLNEQDPRLETGPGRETWIHTSPYHGAIGPILSEDDPRTDVPFVTTVEGLARCPWRTFLSVYLGLAPAADPHIHLPGLENYQLGNLVHEALHVMAQWTLEASPSNHVRPRNVSDVLGRDGVAMLWPEKNTVLNLLNKLARRLLLEHNRGFVGLAPAIASHAFDYLEVVRTYWGERGGLRVLGSELRGEIRGAEPESPVLVRYKVDCVHEGDGDLEFIDYKTGKAPDKSSFFSRVRKGTYLQSAVYAASNDGASGNYIFCNPDRTPGRSMDRSTQESTDTYGLALDQSLKAALGTIRDGLFFPRVVKPNKDAEPDACAKCDVKEACIRGDSGARTRLKKWADRTYADEATRDTSFQRLWRLANGKFDFVEISEPGEET